MPMKQFNTIFMHGEVDYITQVEREKTKEKLLPLSSGFRRRPIHPPPLGDGPTPSLTVLLIRDKGTVFWRLHRQFMSSKFKHVKHGTRNIQNYCHQWLSSSF